MNLPALDVLAPATLIALAVAVALLAFATPIASWLVRFRAGRLPVDLAGRLLEEWLAELAAIGSRAGRLFFAMAIALTRTKTLVDAAGAGESIDRESVVVSVDDVRVYSSFWNRLWASLADTALVWGALWAVSRGAGDRVVAEFLPMALSVLLWSGVVHGYCVLRFGGSPGKRLLKLRIVPIDGGTLTFRQVFLRTAPDLAMTLMRGVVLLAFALLGGALDDPGLTTGGIQAIASQIPRWVTNTIELAGVGWSLAEIAVFFSSSERRALHDHIAGTVVVHDIPRVVVPIEQLR